MANELRLESIASARTLTAEERIARALRLGDDDVEIFRRARGLSPDAALRVLRRSRQTGRRASRCATEAAG